MKEPLPLTGKVALITGASRGIGRAIAVRLATEGADVVVNYRNRVEDARDVALEIERSGRQALVWQADVADRGAVARMFAATVERLGGIDIAVANAYLSIRAPVIEAQWEDVLSTLQVTQFGVFHTCQMAAQQMVSRSLARQRGGGKIVIISSIHEEHPHVTSAPYNMAKAAINHLGRTMAAELASHHINVNMINPGWIDTPGERAFATEEELEEGGKSIPWGRLGRPDDIAAAVSFLVSDGADYITGATLRVDGGLMLR